MALPLDPASFGWSAASDRELVAAVADRRDRVAFGELFGRYAGRVNGFLVKGGLAQTLADDLTQEILLEVWRRADRYAPERASVATWIFTIARSRRIDALRRERVVAVEPEDDDPAPSAEAAIDRERAESTLRAALAGLPEEQRRTLDAAYYRGRSMTEIAEEQQVPVGTVKSRVRMAVERLRGALGGRT